MSEGKKSFLLRLDPKLWDALGRLAAAELRSINGQIEYILRDAVVKRSSSKTATEKEKTQ